MPGEGDQGAYGADSVELVGVRMMIGVHLLGGVGGLLSGMMGEVDSAVTSSDSLMMLLSEIGHCGMGVKIGGCCCWNRMPLTIWLMVYPLCRAASMMAAERRMPLKLKKVPDRISAVFVMKVLVKEPRESFELNI